MAKKTDDTTTPDTDVTDAATAAASAVMDSSAKPVAPPSSLRTNTYAFWQGLQYAAQVASAAPTLKDLQDHLQALASDTRTQLDAIDKAESSTEARIRSGMAHTGAAA